ncbi:MAG: aspartate aminotransferase family protein [Hyphomicrobiaceae bacterium]
MSDSASAPVSSAHVFHRAPKSAMRVAAGGDGPYIIDRAGKRYLDASGGAAVSCLGHSHPKVIAALKSQIDRLAFVHTGFFTAEPIEELADMLAADAPGDLDRVYFTSGGSESLEAALKLARQYFVDRGEPSRHRIVARRQSYHGNTLGALATGGNMWRRRAYEPLLVPVSHIAPCYPYRDRREDEGDEAYGRRIADELDAEIVRLGADNVMCFVAETVSGATLGCVPPVPGYLKRIREICDRHGVLLILDEVMCGMGRTGTLFACEQEGVVPDIAIIAKALGAGYQPIGAMLARRGIFETVVGATGYFQHGHTYTGHVSACAAALAVQKAIKEEDLLANVRARGAELAEALVERFGNHHHVGDIRGRGLFLALELVADRTTRTPFAAERKVAARIKETALENGLMCYPMGGIIDGISGDHVMLAPPFNITSSHVGEIVDKLGRTIEAVTTAAA